MAAEYPEDLCIELAKAYVACTMARPTPSYTRIDDLGTHTLGEQLSNQQRRAAENNEAIGGDEVATSIAHQSTRVAQHWTEDTAGPGQGHG